MRTCLRGASARSTPADVDGQSYYAGAFNALLTLLEHEWKNQVEFFTIFDELWDAPQSDDKEVDYAKMPRVRCDV